MTDLCPEPVLSADETLRQLLELMGIADHFYDFGGQRIEIPLANRLAILGAMGLMPMNDEDVRQLLAAQLQRRFPVGLPATHHGCADLPLTVNLRVADGCLPPELRWQVTLEDGSLLTGTLAGADAHPIDTQHLPDGTLMVHSLPLPPLPIGYHRLRVEGFATECVLICAPARCHEPDWLSAQQRLAGVSVQVYTLRSARNWGIGDFTDLHDLVGHLAPRGVAFVVLNPLHALDALHPDQCSPYSPMDRRFLNPLYLDVERIPEFRTCESAREMVARPAFQARLADLRAEALVDYGSVARLKAVVLSKLFKHFRRLHLEPNSPRAQAFHAWRVARGAGLEAYCELMASRHRISLDQSRHADYHAWLQWLAEEQLQACQRWALELGMSVGLVRDLAVGGNGASAEVQLNPHLFRVDASIGAPPDPLAPQGQNWGLPPMDPNVLWETGFAHFIELLRDNMTHCGALRIDHVMSLMRLWWCPERDRRSGGARTGSESGTYVFYPAETLFAILRLESHRRACVVIGEDLGVVPPAVRSLMADSAVLSNVLFYFEKYDPVHFKRPEHYPPRALAMVANHDVPTLAAWWNRSDLILRGSLGLLPDDAARQRAMADRESDLIQVLHWLEAHGRLWDHWRDFNIHRPFDATLCRGILETVGSGAALLTSLQLEDLTLMTLPVNIPGTSDEYPNWRRKLDVDVDALLADPGRDALVRAFCDARRH